MTEHEHQDDLTQGYRDASAQDERRPGAHVREAVRAHAQMVLDGQRNAQAAQAMTVTTAPAANQSRWKVSAFATVAVVGLAGLLVLQFERGTPEERDIAFGQPRADAPQATPAVPVAPAAPAMTIPSPPPLQPPAVARLPDAPSRPSAQAAPATGAAEPVKEQAAAPMEKSAARKLAVPPTLADAPPAPAQAKGTLSPTPAPGPAAAAAAEPEQAKARSPSTARDNTVYRDLRSGADAAASRAAPAPVAPPAAAPLAAAPVAPAAVAAPAAPELQGGQGMAAPPRARSEVSSPPISAEDLLAAARRGQVAQLEVLVRQGAPLNTADENGRTPLMLAVINGHAAAVKKLLALGANPALVDRYGLNALQHARKLGFTQIAALIEAAS